MDKKKMILLVLIAALVVTYFVLDQKYDLGQYLTLEYLKESQESFGELYSEKPTQIISTYMVIYILMAALSLPGAALLTIAAGAVFGTLVGTIAVSFASTIGATLAFLVSRTLLRDWVQEKFGDKLKAINDGVEREGAFYLFSIRLVPAFPFFLVNILMALTPIKVLSFYFVSQIGMLAGTVVFVFAGTQLATIESTSDILSPRIIIAFIILGVFPLLAKKLLAFIKKKN